MPQIEINIEDPRWDALDLDGLTRTAARAVLGHLGHDPACFEISVLACDDARIRGLNGQFRDKDAPTNVLSWPSWDLGAETDGRAPDAPETGTPDAPEPLGDIALAFDTCAREAEAAGKPLADHVLHLLIHSVLHLLGYDHLRDADAALMEGIEITLLAKLGHANPYETNDRPRR
jgi:probable rRNA maturation factor